MTVLHVRRRQRRQRRQVHSYSILARQEGHPECESFPRSRSRDADDIFVTFQDSHSNLKLPETWHVTEDFPCLFPKLVD
jgi:hypothetical protein